MVLAHRLLQRNAPKVLIASALRCLSDNQIRYRLILAEPESGIFDSDPAVHAVALNASMEKAISASPEQYQWSYKRFKRLKKGEANIYRRQ
jgi:KDO2-lipid IV(A) lauroyltransferase